MSPFILSLISLRFCLILYFIYRFQSLCSSRLPAWCQSKPDLKCLFYDFRTAFSKRLDSYIQDGFVSNTDYCEAYGNVTSLLCFPDDRKISPCTCEFTKECHLFTDHLADSRLYSLLFQLSQLISGKITSIQLGNNINSLQVIFTSS